MNDDQVMNDNDAMNDDTMNGQEAVNDDTLFEDDELMRKVSTPPEFPPATDAQIERTWEAIAERVDELEARRRRSARSGAGDENVRGSGWLQRLFPATPAWAGQLAAVAALLLVGFGAAWIAASQGWLPGTGPDDVPTVAVPGDVGAGTSPDRAWLATNDYGSRLEALLLGVAKGDDGSGDIAPAARQVSRELLDDNRFYQRVARRNDDEALAELLSRVEIILLTLATAPAGQEQDVIQLLRQFIDESDVLDELRAVKTTVPKTPRSRSATTGS